MNRKIAGSILIVFLAVVAFAITCQIGLRVYRFSHPYLDQDVAGPTTISSEWLEIVPKEPLRLERNLQQIVLDIEPPIRSSLPQSMGLLLPDDSVVVPQVQLIDDDGKVYDLHLAYQYGP